MDEPPDDAATAAPPCDPSTSGTADPPAGPSQGALRAQRPDEYEKRHVHSVYDAIASHFSATRYKPWPKVRRFVESLEAGSLLLDVGCGNGKNMGLSAGVINIGCDRCEALLRIARAQNYEVVCCDALVLPFRADLFDAVIQIAVLHHLASAERRVASAREALRVLKPGGQLLLYVWAQEQEKNRGGSDVLISWEVGSRFARGEGCGEGARRVHQRYYHLFKEGELQLLVSELGPCCVVRQLYFDKENWCVELTKVNPTSESESACASK